MDNVNVQVYNSRSLKSFYFSSEEAKITVDKPPRPGIEFRPLQNHCPGHPSLKGGESYEIRYQVVIDKINI